jgi:hypothetical protein
MFDIPRFYISACSNSVQYVRLHPILMSILLYNYKQLTECISEVERIETRVNNSSKERRGLTKKEEEKQEAPATTLDSYFIKNNANLK